MDKKRVRILLRVSSKQQLHDDDIPVQRAELHEEIKKHSDWVYDDEYMEKAVSAYKNKAEEREVLQEILEDASKKKFDVLLVYNSDRIGRLDEYSIYVKTLNTMGIEIWSIKEGQLKTDGPADRLFNTLRFYMNECESEKTSARVRSAQRELIKSGKFLGGKAPFGYELVTSGEISNHGRALKKLQIVEENAGIIREIYSLAIQKGFGYDRIAKALNEKGIQAIETDKWKSSTIASILKNPIYMGYPCINRRINHGNFTRLDRKNWIYAEEQQKELVIIDPTDWERAQQIREARKKRISESTEKSKQLLCEQNGITDKNVPITTKGKLALIGLAYCGYCGKPLKNSSYYNKWTVKATGEKKVAFSGRYSCSNKCKERNGYSQSYLESEVYSVVEDYMEHLKNIDITEELDKIQQQKSKSEQKTLNKIRKEKRDTEVDIETLRQKIPEAIRGDGFFSEEQLAKLLKEKQEKIENLQKLENETMKKIDKTAIKQDEIKQFISHIPNWKEEFQNADVATKKMLLSALIDKVIAKDNEIRILFKIRLEDFDFILKTIDSDTIPYTPCSA